MPTTRSSSHSISMKPRTPASGAEGSRIEDGGPAVDEAERQAPVAGAAVIAEIGGDLCLAAHAGAVDDFEPDVFGDQVAHRVEVAGVEKVDIEAQPPLVVGVERRRGGVFGRCCQHPELRPSAMQRRLGGGERRAGHLACLVQRQAKHVDQDDGAALRQRQMHEGAKAGAGDMPAVGAAGRVFDGRYVGFGHDGPFPIAPAQMVLGGIVGDAKQPVLRLFDRDAAVERLQRLDQRLLHDVLAVDHRTGHAGAVAMQFRAKAGEHRFEGRPVHFWRA